MLVCDGSLRVLDVQSANGATLVKAIPKVVAGILEPEFVSCPGNSGLIFGRVGSLSISWDPEDRFIAVPNGKGVTAL